jgi:GNAT superfamily N-acetyltransferase
MVTRFVYRGDAVVGAGRALADGVDCAYIADIAVHPDHQGRGLGRAIIERLVTAAKGTRRSSSLPIPAPRLLHEARVPPDEHGDGDLARPGRSDRIGDPPKALKAAVLGSSDRSAS